MEKAAMLTGDIDFCRDVAQLVRLRRPFVLVVAELANFDILRSTCSIPDVALACRRFHVAAMAASSEWRTAGILSDIHVGMAFEGIPGGRVQLVPSSEFLSMRSLHEDKTIELKVQFVIVSAIDQPFQVLLREASERLRSVSEAQGRLVERMRQPELWCESNPLSGTD
jgi:hypothetical protein